MHTYLKEVEDYLKSLAPSEFTPSTERIYRIGLSVPTVRKSLKHPFSFGVLSGAEQLAIWDFIWTQSFCYEAMSLCLYRYQYKTLAKYEFGVIVQWVTRCNCWEDSDNLSKIYAQVLEDHTHWILPTLKVWNRSDFSWERRQSVVSLLEYAHKRKRVLPFAELIAFVEPLLEDENYYVQKGVGWTLREIYNVYPEATLTFLENHLGRLSSQAYSSATEKIDPAQKQCFNQQRKALRQQRKALQKKAQAD